jgi:hypothetical protein
MTGGKRDAPERSAGSPPEQAPSIGAYLSAQRRLRGISIEDLSHQTRIPLRSLERLEAGSFDADVDGFVRGFVRTVAAALGLDADEALNRTLREPEDAGGGRPPSTLSFRRVAFAVAGVAGLAALAIAVPWIASSLPSKAGSEGSGTPIVVRRDPVRALADAQGLAALAPAPALSLAESQTRPPARNPAGRETARTANDASVGRDAKGAQVDVHPEVRDAEPGAATGPPAAHAP